MNRKGITLIVIVFLINSCHSSSNKNVFNKDGNYTLEILPDWKYKIEDANTRISKTMLTETKSMSGTLLVTTMESTHSTLNESFNYLIGTLPDNFINYKKISVGETFINGISAKWHRMEDEENDLVYVTLQYIMQLNSKDMIVMNCSSTKDSFAYFEEDFTKMVFSFKQINSK
jgi:hypothetical protein